MPTEKKHAGEFLLSEASGKRSREVVTIDAGLVLEAGTVLGLITADGVYSNYDNGNVDGTETAVAILWDAIDTSATGTNADTEALVIFRDAEVDGNLLVGSDAAGIVELASKGIIVRS